MAANIRTEDENGIWEVTLTDAGPWPLTVRANGNTGRVNISDGDVTLYTCMSDDTADRGVFVTRYADRVWREWLAGERD